MDRRKFVRLSTAGFASCTVLPGVLSVNNRAFARPDRSYKFRAYRPAGSACPVYQVTPDDGSYIHTFYDVCPWSPSGRYLAVTKVPFDDRKPVLGDLAEVAVVDLRRESIRVVYKTKAWSFQLGANVQWGNDDRFLFCNDVIDHVAVCVRVDLETGETMAFAGPKYDLNGSASQVIGARLELMNATQYGYGIPDDTFGYPIFAHADFENDDGLWYTTLAENKKNLLFSYADVRKTISMPSFYETGVFYFFHSRYNARANKILQVVRCLIPGKKGRNSSLFIYDIKSQSLQEVLNRRTWENKGPMGMGNHPNWHPDGEHIVMNLVPGWENDNTMRFCLLKADGSHKKVLSRKIPGSGHPSMEPSSRFVVTDAYPDQHWVTRGDGEVPIRLIDLDKEIEISICSIFTDLARSAGLKDYKVKGGGSHFKLDPHPAWSRDYKHICFNGAPAGRRQVFISDLKTVLQ